MVNRINNLYEFDGYLLNSREKNLWRGEELIPLPPKVLDTLLILVENAGRIVSKDEILESVWAETFVEESNLSQNIYSIRQVFGKENRYIETIPRKGYKFVADVNIRPTDLLDDTRSNDLQSETQTELPLDTKIHSADQRDIVSKNRRILVKKAARFAALGMAVLVVLIVAGYSLKKVRNTGDLPSGQIVLKSLTDTGSAISPTISPDGRFVAYIDRRSEKGSVRLMDIEAGEDVEVNIGGGLVPGVVKFSHDGKDLFFRIRGLWRTGRTIHRVSYFGGNPTPVAKNVWGNFSVSPDGKYIAYFREDAASNRETLLIQDLGTGEEKILVERNDPKQFFMLVAPEWSHDSKAVTFLEGTGSESRSEINIADIDTGNVTTVKTELNKLFHLAWATDGRSIFALSKEPEKGRQLWRVSIPSGTVTKVTNDLNMYNGLSISADGKHLVTEKSDTAANVWLYRNADINSGKPLTSGTYGHFAMVDLDFATEDRIVYDKREEVERDLWAVSISGASHVRLTHNNGPRNTQVTSSPDGRYIYISSNRDGTARIWRIGQDGTDPIQMTFGKRESHWYPALSHDGQNLYFLARRGDQSEIRRMDISTQNVKTIYKANDFAPMHFFEISPDGRYLAFVHRETNADMPDPDDISSIPIKIGILDLSGNDAVRTVNIVTSAAMIRFTSGGRTFDYLKGGSIVRQSTEDENAEPQTVFSTPNERIYNFDWSMAGTDLVVSKGGSTADVVLISLPQ
ncbi:MAG: PD40 domain-containing protein [Acidobacteria bacterium]|nr:PD40 domain-containing protein [Acidobacteriota bacterium]